MFFLGIDGHDFIYDRLNDFTKKFDYVICNNTIIKNQLLNENEYTDKRPYTICMKTDFLPKYVKFLSEFCTETGGNFILVTCSSSYSPNYHYPEETKQILENLHLLYWFSTNNTIAEGAGLISHPKMRHFPSGLNYHNTELQKECEILLLQNSQKNTPQHIIPSLNFLYCPPNNNFLLNDSYCKTFCGIQRNLLRGENFLEKSPLFYFNSLLTGVQQHKEYYEILVNYKFLLCPYDATIEPSPTRVWEALALGVIPVIIYNSLTIQLFKNLPIWFINDWEEIFNANDEFLNLKYTEIMNNNTNFSIHNLSIDYWFQYIFKEKQIIDLDGVILKNHSDYLLNCKSSIENVLKITPLNKRIIFSFCIYGNNIMYYDGLKENILIISKYFGGLNLNKQYKTSIFIYTGTSVNNFLLCKIFKDIDNIDINIINTKFDGVKNMIFRYSGILYSVNTADYYFIRDADSIIGERDLWCICDFIEKSQQTPYSCHIIRDHFFHKSKITGGLTGFTKLGMEKIVNILKTHISSLNETQYNDYGNDEEFLNKFIYPLLLNEGNKIETNKIKIFVHSNFCVFPEEIHFPILYKNTNTNFCGNVKQVLPIPYYQFIYSDFDIYKQWEWITQYSNLQIKTEIHNYYFILFIQTIISLRTNFIFSNEDFDVFNKNHLFERLYQGIKQLPYKYRSKTILFLLQSYLKLQFIYGCFISFQLYAYCEIDEQAKILMWSVLKLYNKTILFTTDENIIPTDENIPIIIYGSYPDDWTSYPSKYIIRRNIIFYDNDIQYCKNNDISFEWLEHSIWKPIKQIYIMGLETSQERMYDTKQELAKIGIPLYKIKVYLAKKDIDTKKAYLGATHNHTEVIKLATETYKNNTEGVILFLEDDFVFSGNAKIQIQEFWNRQHKYDYDICLLAASKMHERTELDDLISYSKQICTTSSAYFIKCGYNLEKIEKIVCDGFNKLKETGDSNSYCIDRYWTLIQQNNKMILFKEKLGFQRPSISKITGLLNTMLD